MTSEKLGTAEREEGTDAATERKSEHASRTGESVCV